LSQMTSDVVQACRVQPGQSVNGSPANTVGYTLIMPGGNGGYPAFWVRDFAMSLGSGCITPQEMSDQLQLIAQSQNGSNALNLANGLIVPPYAIPDHIEFNGSPTFYPGTYATGTNQGDGTCGLLPPADDHYWFVHVAYCLFRAQGGTTFLSVNVKGMTMLQRLVAAFNAPTTDPQTGLFETAATNRAVGFGFCDGVYFTGKILFASVLRYQAAGELAAMYQAMGQSNAAAPYLQIEAVYQTDPGLAAEIFAQYVQYLQANDYRLGQGPQAPWACFHPPSGYTQNGVYMTSVTAPNGVIGNMSIPVPPAAPGTTGR